MTTMKAARMSHTTNDRLRKAALAEINGRLAKIDQPQYPCGRTGEEMPAPNYLRFKSALDKARRAHTKSETVARLCDEAMAAYKAKNYGLATRLADEAWREATNPNPEPERKTTSDAAGDADAPTEDHAMKTAKPRKTKAAKEPKPARQSALNLAAAYLARCENPKNIKEITEAVLAAGWKTEGKTPGATLNAAIIREIKAKGKESRFAKADRGMFTKGAA